MSEILLIVGLAVWGYAYVGYPLLLLTAERVRRRRSGCYSLPDAPRLSITIPVFNGAPTIGAALDALLACDYPVERRQIVVVSDGSTDATDEIVRGYAAQGVALVRIPVRGGKTAAEAVAAPHLRGEIVVNTDASVRLDRRALRALVAALADPSVGVASGRDVSVAPDARLAPGESAYVGYEMWVRNLETRAGGIVGSSGSLYAIRTPLHRRALAPNLSRDFASALIARESGYRAVSVPDAICYVPRSGSLRREYRRKVRTMARGLATLAAFRYLLDPRRRPWFAWRLFSHKLCRWLTPFAAVAIVVGLFFSAITSLWAAVGLAGAVAVALLGTIGWARADDGPLPRILSAPAYLLCTTLAGLAAWYQALNGGARATWEPTRRTAHSLR
ncbi:MAG: glycosyltransferase [Gemmatimonadales bacterium]